MSLPAKGERVSLERILAICEEYGLHELRQQIADDPPPKPFRSDGCSGWPDKWLGGRDLYEGCFIHDIFYWAGRPADDLAALEKIGESLGVLFQFKDDELGIFGDEDVLGKPTDSDIREGKKTLYYHYLMTETGPEERKKLVSIFGDASVTAQDVRYVQDLVKASGISGKVEEKLAAYAEKTEDTIEALEDVSETYRDLLRDLLRFNLTRRR